MDTKKLEEATKNIRALGNTKKIKVDEITITDLVREAFRIQILGDVRMAQNEWKQKTIAQAIADKEGIVTLHFGTKKFFDEARINCWN